MSIEGVSLEESRGGAEVLGTGELSPGCEVAGGDDVEGFEFCDGSVEGGGVLAFELGAGVREGDGPCDCVSDCAVGCVLGFGSAELG